MRQWGGISMTNISSPIIKSLLQSISTEPADGRDGSRRVNSGKGEAGEGEGGERQATE